MPRLIVGCLVALLLAGTAAAAQEGQDDGYAKGLELFRNGRYEEAKPYFQQVLDAAIARHGADNPGIAVELNNLAEIERLTGQLDDAEKLYRRAIALDEKAGRQNSAEFATSLNNLALVYRAQGRLPEAERLYLRSLGVLEKALGPNHPDVARSLNNLAVLYRSQGRPERAQPLQERALRIAEQQLGTSHPTTVTIRRNLASLGGPAATTAAPERTAPVPQARPGTVLAGREPAPPAAAVGIEPGHGGFVVQVAAVDKMADFADEWRRQQRLFPVLQPLRLQPAERTEVPGKGTYYRLLAGPLATRADADAICRQLRAGNGFCRVIER